LLKNIAKWEVPSSVLTIALGVIEAHLCERRHDDLDTPVGGGSPPVSAPQWHAMLFFCYNMLGDGLDRVNLPEVPPPRRNLSTMRDPPRKAERLYGARFPTGTYTLEDAIGSHACSLEALPYV
jgi:hypothetical protein